MMRYSSLVLAAAAVVASVAEVRAQTAGMMSFQALLKDGGGTPVIGAVTLQLQIVDGGNVVLDANGDGIVNGSDTFTVNTTAVDGVISIKYGPVAPSAFNGATRFLKVAVTNPPLPALTPVEIVTPPAIAEQLNARGTANTAVITTPAGNVGIGTNTPTALLQVGGNDPGERIRLTHAPYGLGNFGVASEAHTGLYANGTYGLAATSLGMHDGVTYSPILTVRPDGRVGIGTTTPTAPLTIRYGSAGVTSILQRLGTNGNSVGTAGLIQFTAAEDSVPYETARIYAQLLGGGAVRLNLGAGGGSEGPLNIRENGNVGIGDYNPIDKLLVAGNVRANTFFASCGTLTCSDSRLKKDIRPLAGAVDIVSQLRPVSFQWRTEEFPNRTFPTNQQIGFIAQEALEVVPEIVQEDSDCYYSVDYGRLTPLLTAAIQELHAKHKAETTELKSEVSRLKSEISVQTAMIEEFSRRLAQLEARGGVTSADGGR